VLPIFLSIGLMGWIKGLKCLLGWQSLPLFGRFGYVEMMLFLMQKIALLYRSSTGAVLYSVHAHLFSI
jgi:hypothetical protein